jgi:hypothetical protein
VSATIVSAIDFVAPALVSAAAWQIVPLPSAIVIHREDASCDEQTAALPVLALPRTPPRAVVVA